MCWTTWATEAVILFFVISNGSCDPTPIKLAPASVDIRRDKITLAGVSSGGSMAQHLQISYSSLFSGIAVFSHTYYRCGIANGNIDDYHRYCTILHNSTDRYDPALVHKDIQTYRSEGLIEDPMNLRHKRLYVYAGLRNRLFTLRQSLNILRIYQPYIGTMSTIFTRIQDANLVLPTDSTSFGSPCEEYSESSALIGQCGFSGVGEALPYLLELDPGSKSPPDELSLSSVTNWKSDKNHPNESWPSYWKFYGETVEAQEARISRLSTFDQREFTQGLEKHNMDDTGYIYVPYQCQGNSQNGASCYLHFYFHGCLSGREHVNLSHVENSGLLPLADNLGIIVVFPQTRSSTENPTGSWDTFGLSGPFYATKRGAQVTAVKRMLDRVMGTVV